MKTSMELLLRLLSARIKKDGYEVSIKFSGDNVQVAAEYCECKDYTFDENDPLTDALVNILEIYSNKDAWYNKEVLEKADEYFEIIREVVYR